MYYGLMLMMTNFALLCIINKYVYEKEIDYGCLIVAIDHVGIPGVVLLPFLIIYWKCELLIILNFCLLTSQNTSNIVFKVS